MAPPKKRRKVIVPEESSNDGTDRIVAKTPDDTAGAASPSMTRLLLEQKDALLQQLTEALDALESGDEASGEAPAILLLKLKALQRTVLSKARTTQELLREQALRRDQQTLRLENLQAQEDLHQASHQRSEEAMRLASSVIAKVVPQTTTTNEPNETEPAATMASSPGGENATKDPEAPIDDHGEPKESSQPNHTQQVLQSFLGDDWQNPERKDGVLARLHHELDARTARSTELGSLRSDRQAKREALAGRTQLLRDLPAKLKDLERASLPLQAFCHRQRALLRTPVALGTSHRRQRLERARKLPGALYAVLCQLQSCLEVRERASRRGGEATPRRKPPTVDTDETTVRLRIPPHTVRFRYGSDNETVYASLEGSSTATLDGLLGPDDGDPEASPLGTAYSWCQHLAGLAPVGAVPNRSSGAVLQALEERCSGEP